jgi:hypothetical protein
VLKVRFCDKSKDYCPGCTVCTAPKKRDTGTTHSRNKALDDVCVNGKFWVASKEAPVFYLPLFLALAHEAISAIAPPELINRGTYVGTYIVIGEVARGGNCGAVTQLIALHASVM